MRMNKRRFLVLTRKAGLLTFAGKWREAQALLPVMLALEAPGWAAVNHLPAPHGDGVSPLVAARE